LEALAICKLACLCSISCGCRAIKLWCALNI